MTPLIALSADVLCCNSRPMRDRARMIAFAAERRADRIRLGERETSVTSIFTAIISRLQQLSATARSSRCPLSLLGDWNEDHSTVAIGRDQREVCLRIVFLFRAIGSQLFTTNSATSTNTARALRLPSGKRRQLLFYSHFAVAIAFLILVGWRKVGTFEAAAGNSSSLARYS